MRISLKAINSELERRGSHALLAKGDGYFYFRDGDATDWIDRTVRVPTLHSLTLDQWIERYRELKDKNREPLRGGIGPQAGDQKLVATKRKAKQVKTRYDPKSKPAYEARP